MQIYTNATAENGTRMNRNTVRRSAMAWIAKFKKRMQVESLHPGVTLAQVQESTGFELTQAPTVSETTPPNDHELRILRDEVDPCGYIIGR